MSCSLCIRVKAIRNGFVDIMRRLVTCAPWGIIWIKVWIKFNLLSKLFRKVDSQGEDVTNRPVPNSKTACVILICFFNKMVFRAVWSSSSRVTRNLLPYFWKAYYQNTAKSSQELCYRLFYGCSRWFYEIRQKEQKFGETWKTTWLP